MLDIHKIEVRDLPELWFQAVYDIFEHGRKFTIDEGSNAGQTRLEYDYFIGHVKFPYNKPLLPEIPPGCAFPAPVEEAYIYGGKGYDRSYIEYLMTGRKEEGEAYTYGERLSNAIISNQIINERESEKGQEIWQKFKTNFGLVPSVRSEKHIPEDEHDMVENDLFLNQIDWIIEKYNSGNYRNNQLVLQVAQPTDLLLLDPPCLRHIDTRIQDGKLHFFVYFRSWDLWGGLPANLAGIVEMQKYMADHIEGIEIGEMVVESKGLHLYGYAEDLAKVRCNFTDLV